MTTTLNINNVQINSEEFTQHLRRYLNLAGEMEALKEDMKTVVAEAAEKHKMERSVLSAYFKARAKAKTKEVAEQGEMFAAIDNLIDN